MTPQQGGSGSRPGADDVVVLADAATQIAGRTVWSGVNLRLRAGEFAAVLGPNGAGKSTLLKVVLGIQPASSGRVRVLGAPAGQRNSRIGYLPQRRAFDPDVRIRGVDVVRLGWDGDRWGLPMPGRRNREGARRVDEVIDLVGARSYAGRPIGRCSGGEQQRLLIAQALVRRPDLLVLDEPLDSLDVTNQASISALIRSICRDQGVTVMLVAHDVNPILPALDQVIYLARHGAAAGTPESIITADRLSALYETPIEVLHDRTGRLVVVGQPDGAADHRLGTARAGGPR